MSPSEVNERLKLAVQSFKADIGKLEAQAARIDELEARVARLEHYIKASATIEAYKTNGEMFDPVKQRKQLLAARNMAVDATAEVIKLVLQVAPAAAAGPMRAMTPAKMLEFLSDTIGASPIESEKTTAEGTRVLAAVAEFHAITWADLGL